MVIHNLNRVSYDGDTILHEYSDLMLFQLLIKLFKHANQFTQKQFLENLDETGFIAAHVGK